MKYGYMRVSTKGQAKDGNSLEAQKEMLLANGVTDENIYSDAFTGTKMHRPQFDELIKKLEKGDVLIVTKLDRIARSTIEGATLVRELIDKGVTINVLNIGILDNSPTGKMMTTMFLAIAEFERDLIVSRTQEGKEIAKKQNPNYRDGRKPTDQVRINHALDLLDCGETYKQVARETGISVSTIQRARRRQKEAELLALASTE